MTIFSSKNRYQSGMSVLGRYVEKLPVIEFRETIPKNLFFIFFGGEIKKDFLDNINSLSKSNPEYFIRIFNEDMAKSFISEVYGTEILRYFQRINPTYNAARSDFLRYLLIYAYGGIYLDVKSGFSKKIDQCVIGNESFILTQWMNNPGQIDEGFGLRKAVGDIPGGEYQQWHVIGSPGHPFLKNVIAAMLYEIDKYTPWTHLTGRMGVLNVTGPILYTNVIYKIEKIYQRKFYRYETEACLVYTNFDRNHHIGENHYSKSRDPVILLGFFRSILYSVHKIFVNIEWRLGGKKSLKNDFY